jgi:inorganic pyrophosphatase
MSTYAPDCASKPAICLGALEQLADDDRAVHARVLRDLAHGCLQRAPDDIDADLLIVVRRPQCGERFGRVEERCAAAGDNSFLDGRSSCVHRVFDPVLAFLHLDLGGAADADHRNRRRRASPAAPGASHGRSPRWFPRLRPARRTTTPRHPGPNRFRRCSTSCHHYNTSSLAKDRAHLPPLSSLSTFDEATGDLAVIIETPKDSPNKYDYDPDCGAFRLAGVLPHGQYFPFDFGFVPSTLGDDGDPLDVLLLLDASVPVGCVLSARLVGVIEAKQREDGRRWVRNDRLLAVATHAHTHQHVRSLNDLESKLIDEIEAFFINYNRAKGKEFKPLKRSGPKPAAKIVQHGMKAFKRKRS